MRKQYHKIFISQNEFNLGRNRNIRRLDAKLDSQSKFSQSSPLSNCSDTGKETGVSNESPPFMSFPVNNLTQIDKFYLKYGFNWKEKYL